MAKSFYKSVTGTKQKLEATINGSNFLLLAVHRIIKSTNLTLIVGPKTSENRSF